MSLENAIKVGDITEIECKKCGKKTQHKYDGNIAKATEEQLRELNYTKEEIEDFLSKGQYTCQICRGSFEHKKIK